MRDAARSCASTLTALDKVEDRLPDGGAPWPPLTPWTGNYVFSSGRPACEVKDKLT